MSAEHLQHLIMSGGETDELDFKEQLNLTSTKGKYEFLKDVAAFANATGGYIVVGVSNDGTGVGLTEKIDLSDIHNIIESFFGFPIGVAYCQHTLADKNIYGLVYIPNVTERVVVVPKSGNYSDGCKTKSVICEGDVYYRRGSRSIKARPEDYELIMRKLKDHHGKPQPVKKDANIPNSRSVNAATRHWESLSDGENCINEHGRTSVKRFLQDLSLAEVKQAMDIAFSKKITDSEARFRYFCGIVHNMIAERNGDSVSVLIRRAKAYFQSKPRGSGYFVEHKFREYAERFDYPVLKKAIDETFSMPRGNYFASLCEILSSYAQVGSSSLHVLDCGFCDGKGYEPPTAYDNSDFSPCRICNGKGVVAVETDSTILPCKVCEGTGRKWEDGYFFGDTCEGCGGVGYQSLIGELKVHR